MMLAPPFECLNIFVRCLQMYELYESLDVRVVLFAFVFVLAHHIFLTDIGILCRDSSMPHPWKSQLPPCSNIEKKVASC